MPTSRLLERAAALSGSSAHRRLLVLVLHRGPEPPAIFDGRPARRLVLGPLGSDAVAEIASLYLPAGSEALPVDALAAESGGVPLSVHRVARDWARARASASIGASAGRTGNERGELRSAEADLSDDLLALQALEELARRYGGEAGAPPLAAVCPFPGLATFDAAHAEYFFGRERLVAELVARLVGSPLLAVIGPSGSGKSSAVRAGLLPALAGGVLPGSERWRQALIRPGPHPMAQLERVRRGAGGACGAGGRPVRGGVHGLPRRGRADRVPGFARGTGGGPRPERPGRGRRARRLLRPLRDARSARAAGGREPGAGRPDAARRAAPCDRRAGATGRPAGRAVADGRADRRRARPAGRPAAAVRRPARAVARARGARAAPCGVRPHRRRARGGGPVGGADLLGSERAGARRGPGDPAAARRCRRAPGRVRAPPDAARRARSRTSTPRPRWRRWSTAGS